MERCLGILPPCLHTHLPAPTVIGAYLFRLNPSSPLRLFASPLTLGALHCHWVAWFSAHRLYDFFPSIYYQLVPGATSDIVHATVWTRLLKFKPIRLTDRPNLNYQWGLLYNKYTILQMDTFAVSDTSVNMRHPWIAEAKIYIHHSQERTNMHSRLLNVVKNHGQVVNPLKSWSRTRVYRHWWWASEFVISFHTEIDIEPTRYNVHPSSYASRSYSGVKGALIEKALKVPLCSSYGVQNYTHFFVLLFCEVQQMWCIKRPW